MGEFFGIVFCGMFIVAVFIALCWRRSKNDPFEPGDDKPPQWGGPHE